MRAHLVTLAMLATVAPAVPAAEAVAGTAKLKIAPCWPHAPACRPTI